MEHGLALIVGHETHTSFPTLLSNSDLTSCQKLTSLFPCQFQSFIHLLTGVKGKNLNKSVHKEKTFSCACALPFSFQNVVISSDRSCSLFAGSPAGYRIKRKLESAHKQGIREGKFFKRCPSVQGTWQSRISRAPNSKWPLPILSAPLWSSSAKTLLALTEPAG